jgi:hypothetical protein
MVSRINEATLSHHYRIPANDLQVPSSPSPGTSPHRIASHTSHTDRCSPVIVAEKMIGVAMYELVCDAALLSLSIY